MIGLTLLIVIIAIVLIWIVIEVKRLKHKIFAIFLIFMILFLYASFTFTVKTHDIDLKSFDGMKEFGVVYLSWMGSLFGNMKSITANAINMNWGINESVS